MLRVRYMSDLHIEYSNFKIDYSDCDILLLVGDISSNIDDFYRIFQGIPETLPVYLILGNHEFDFQFVNKHPFIIKDFLRENNFNNVQVLHNEYVDIGDVRIIGSTLWSDCQGYFKYYDINNGDLFIKSEATIQTGILNYLKIYHEDSPLQDNIMTVNLMKQEFIKSYNFIKNSLDTDKKCIVATHFAPFFEAALVYSSSRPITPISSFWANHIPELMGKPQYWVHGHIHASFNKNVQGTTIISNPRGNSKIFNQAENPYFDKKATFKI